MPRVEARSRLGRLLPLIDITVAVDDRKIAMLALVDTGSSSTIVPGELLGFHGVQFDSLDDARTGRGAGGSITFRIARGQIQWQGHPFASAFAVAEPGSLPLALLGRDDFFRTFLVCFDWTSARPFMNIDLPM